MKPNESYFTPAEVDGQIDRLLAAQSDTTPSERLIHNLQMHYASEAAEGSALARIWASVHKQYGPASFIESKNPLPMLPIQRHSVDQALGEPSISNRRMPLFATAVAFLFAILTVVVFAIYPHLNQTFPSKSAPPTVAIRTFSLPTTCDVSCNPDAITFGPDGNLWFIESSGNRIGRITPTGHIQEFPLPTTCHSQQPCGINGITTGPDGNLWFTESTVNSIGQITPTGRIQLFPLPSACGNDCATMDITTGPDDNLWFTIPQQNIVGRITPAGQIQEFPLPSACQSQPLCAPFDIINGPDGSLWFTEVGSQRIGRITPDGHIQEFPLPPSCKPVPQCSPTGITNGPGGNLWFTEQTANKIGSISPPK